MAGMRFCIRDILWLMVAVALAVSWHIDNSRIETTVKALEREIEKLADDRRLMQAEFDDKLTVVDQLQRQARDKLWGRPTGRVASRPSSEKP